jgi:large conductance mechanosensitive channel
VIAATPHPRGVSPTYTKEHSVVLQEFKDFVSKGNLVELAVAFVLAAAFGALVTSFIDNIVMTIIGAIVGKPSFDALEFKIGKGVVRYGAFLTTMVNFLIIAFVMFLVVKAYNKMKKSAPPAAPSSTDALLMEIRDGLKAR